MRLATSRYELYYSKVSLAFGQSRHLVEGFCSWPARPLPSIDLHARAGMSMLRELGRPVCALARARSHATAASGRERALFRHFLPLQTRWKDNDVFGHVNNVEYYSFFDTVVNHYLIKEGGLVIGQGADTVGFCVHSSCNFYRPVAYPALLEAAMAVEKMGKSSVTYRVGLFDDKSEDAAAVGSFVHAFVDIATQKSVSELPQQLRNALERVSCPLPPQ